MLYDLAETVKYACVFFASYDFPVLQLYSCLYNIKRVPFYTLSITVILVCIGFSHHQYLSSVQPSLSIYTCCKHSPLIFQLLHRQQIDT
jgi:hypothetical protein